jgi:hypothetical protein
MVKQKKYILNNHNSVNFSFNQLYVYSKYDGYE